MPGESESSDDEKISSVDDLSEEKMKQLEKQLKKEETDQPGSTLTHCPACAVKALVLCYWGNQNLHSSGQPNALPLANPELARVHNVDGMLQRFTPGAAAAGANAQEDPEEMQTRLLTACLESVNYHHPANTDWKARYDALFILQLECIWSCATCNTVVNPLPPGTNEDGVGFNNIGINPMGTPDSLNAAIYRFFEPADLGIRSCTQCNTPQRRNQTLRIEASPEYLRIKISIVDFVNLAMVKNFNPVALPNLLDLSEYQATRAVSSLKYKLSSVISHSGETLDAGHWVASVRGPREVFYINDGVAVQKLSFELRANPQMYGTSGTQAVVLMYKRFPANN
ncbi:hypothetical protein G6011_00718 [Alternaria panax]|uniref:ubiquitinyl hydrolase 1 n=1 Tax=Alternaria panax TaxID=48097 RepID=A0AAD4IIP1_9PLEO|nr:hypothetical protein G6011_00718 [Alternaria panax]